MSQDEQHLELLSIFHYVVGVSLALASCIPLIHLAIGVAIVCGAMDGPDAPPPFFGWFFILFAAAFILIGWTCALLIVSAGRRLKRRTSYRFCLVVAAAECLWMPLGTVLGVFMIVVLMKESVKALFEADPFARPGPESHD